MNDMEQTKECEHEFGYNTIGGFPGHEHTHITGYQVCLNCGKTFREILSIKKQKIIEKFDNILAEELLICNQERQPTSRLISLYFKFKQTINK